MNNNAGSDIIGFLSERYQQFRKEGFLKHQNLFNDLAGGQNPRILFIACSDSRVVPHVILSASPGDIFECKIVGNIIPAYGDTFGGVTATLEYAVTVLKVQAIIVCGHSDCGAMKAKYAGTYQHVPTVDQWLKHSDVALRIVKSEGDTQDDITAVNKLAHENVIAQIENMRTHPAVALGIRNGLQVIGWFYDIQSGEVEILDFAKHEYSSFSTPIPDSAQPVL